MPEASQPGESEDINKDVWDEFNAIGQVRHPGAGRGRGCCHCAHPPRPLQSLTAKYKAQAEAAMRDKEVALTTALKAALGKISPPQSAPAGSALAKVMEKVTRLVAKLQAKGKQLVEEHAKHATDLQNGCVSQRGGALARSCPHPALPPLPATRRSTTAPRPSRSSSTPWTKRSQRLRQRASSASAPRSPRAPRPASVRTRGVVEWRVHRWLTPSPPLPLAAAKCKHKLLSQTTFKADMKKGMDSVMARFEELNR